MLENIGIAKVFVDLSKSQLKLILNINKIILIKDTTCSYKFLGLSFEWV